MELIDDIMKRYGYNKANKQGYAVNSGWVGMWSFEHYDKDGKLIWKDTIKNALANEGQELMLDDVLRADAGATQFYIRLYNDTPVKTDGLADLSGEPSTNGYAAQLVEKDATGWPTLALSGGDFQATSKQVTFVASGGSWGPVTYATLATTSDNTGKLMAFVVLSQSRTINNGESLKIILNVKQV